jgi:hypothetical protein
LDLNNRERSDALLDKARFAIETIRQLMATPPNIALEEAQKLAWQCDELASTIQIVPANNTHKQKHYSNGLIHITDERVTRTKKRKKRV